MAVAGVAPAAVALAFEEGDLLNIQDEVMRCYWKHVRELLRKVPVFDRKLEFMSNFYERSPEELLDAIATAHFPRITIACTQPGFNLLRSWINELYDEAKATIESGV